MKKYGPTIVESGGTLVDGGYSDGYNDNSVDYAVNSYDVENFETPNGDVGGDVVGWYGGERPVLSARPSPVVVAAPAAEHRKSGYRMPYRTGLGLLALFKMGLIKMAAFKAIKSMLLFAIKLKLFMLFKLFAFAKFFVLSKLLKLFVLPMLPNFQSLLSMLLNPTMSPTMSTTMSPSSMMMMMPMMNMTMLRKDAELSGQARNSSGVVVEPLEMRSANDIDLFRFVTAVNTAKCVERMACHVAATRPPSFQSTWTNW